MKHYHRQLRGLSGCLHRDQISCLLNEGYLQSLDAGHNGVEGGLHVCGGARGNNRLVLLLQDVGHILQDDRVKSGEGERGKESAAINY